jgi:hypothetical protein
MKRKMIVLFSHMDWIDWLLAVAFTACLTWLGIALFDFPYWLAFPVIALVLLGLAKNRRDRMREDQ